VLYAHISETSLMAELTVTEKPRTLAGWTLREVSRSIIYIISHFQM